MLINVYCIPCLLRMVKNILKQLSLGETVSKIVYEHTENIPAMRGRSWDVTSIDIIEEIMNILKSVTGIYDPFEEQKRDQNSLVMNIYPFLEEMVNQAPDPLYEALRLAIIDERASPDVYSSVLRRSQTQERFHQR